MKEYELGDVFEYDGKLIRVEYYPGVCDGCYFQEKCSYGECVPGELPKCEAEDRKDMTYVYFMEV
jgi:hypothetical protein